MMTKIVGRCLVCGAIHHREVPEPKQWIEARSVWCQCGNEIHGIKWSLPSEEVK